ncbi:nucleoside diphosphate kinase regulator [Glaciimonas sp. PAMC28666]|uniref:nucleoside diphosphate kinase regulator n=1 Tax=Glaciimonas sp. PAMC28666 TaxID=2807626 RepID=UPI001962E6EB|nr:nucleoside diphosphate kinase regulator [Glaciimonas sp. PAMC28666]QRX84277.1 nucleoside diphosphate kinase regulator [Glaciimonas sp. PAMC28666]
MDVKPPITLSSFDMERIEQLLESSTYRNAPAVDSLNETLLRAQVVRPEDIPADVVTMNSAVRFMDDKTNTEHILKLVYPHQATTPDAVSILAPVGSALLGLSVGQSVAWQGPVGRECQLHVLEVTYQPEANGQYNL